MIAPYRASGVILDIGTGDGRFVSAQAKANPDKFYIGIDANAKALEKPSMKATRKPAKGGLPNAMFVQAAVEDLPEELNGTADQIHINFPWGSLLRSVALGDPEVLASLRRIAAPGCRLELIIGTDQTRDRSELDRLGIPDLTEAYVKHTLVPRYASAGFSLDRHTELSQGKWAGLETSWARRLSDSQNRKVIAINFI